MNSHGKNMTVLEHLEELRGRLIKVVICVALCAVGSYFFSDRLLSFLTAPAAPFIERFYFFKPADAFVVRLKIAALTAVFVSAPIILYQLWMFVTPGLYAAERSVLLPAVGSSAALFLAGVVFAYKVILPAGLGFLLSYKTSELLPLLAIGDYIDFSGLLLLAFGIVFDLPVFIVGLVKLHAIKAATLARARKAVIVGAFIIGAVLTPGPDVVMQIMLAVPLLLLYELSVWVAVLIERMEHRPKKHA